MRDVVNALVLCLLTWSAVAQDATSTATQTTTGAADQQKKSDEPQKSDEPKKTDEPKKADEPKKPDDPVITKVYRDPAYPEEQTYKIHLLGTGFDPDEKKNQLLVNQIQLPACKDGATTACIKKVENVTDGRELLFTLADHGQYHRQQKVKLAIEVGDLLGAMNDLDYDDRLANDGAVRAAPLPSARQTAEPSGKRGVTSSRMNARSNTSPPPREGGPREP